MRVAVCLSGQLRQWDYAKENQKWFWTSFNYDPLLVDYFIHTWDYSQDRAGVSQPYVTRKVTDEEYSKVVDFYAPKKSRIESKTTEDFYHNDHWSSLFYSMGQSILMKREYELENNFEYDLVVKSRPDVVFNPTQHAYIPGHILDNQLYTTHGGEMEMEFYNINFNDCVFYGKSYTMDLLINLYTYRQQVIRSEKEIAGGRNFHPLGPGVLMHDYFHEYGISTIYGTRWLETLLKEGCPKVDLFNNEEFEQVEQYFREWYSK